MYYTYLKDNVTIAVNPKVAVCHTKKAVYIL
jgi:hypothetical protein